ncbi:hypothetical protein PVT68_11035 [Microbulbifer bruguierae]|uniref:Glycosyltransferase RgtA/B/C/D-like domain-containing protein n=1 Tax=Microbulbifer bruguierae TaxID=3029061 RepID=A0ABY8NCZ5_9GAMM|nr:hypothetical protein [Microbulbifer bruguierae]WGL15303.1 hypothetical protein PVT68_11035 [Microbulbifer bruguierae]
MTKQEIMERLSALLPKLSFVLTLATGLRLLWALLIPVVPLSDSHAYDIFALNIWQHGTYGWSPETPESYWAVGTSALYASLYMLFGHSYWPIVFINILLSVGIIYFSYRLCEVFLPYSRAPILTAYLLTFWPTGILYVTVLASELPYMFLSMAGFYYFVTAPATISRFTLTAGLLFAAAYYVRPLITVAILMFAISCVLYSTQRFSQVCGRTLCALAVIVIMVAPWAYRNYQLYHDFVPNSSNGGSVFWMGNSPDTDGGYANIPKNVKDQAGNTYEQSKILKQQALEYIAAEPVAFVKRSFYKLYRFHSYETIGVSWNREGIEKTLGQRALLPLKALTQFYWLILVACGFVGMLLMWRNFTLWKLACHPFTLSWASSAGIHAIIVSQDRYHLPTVPFVAAFAAITLVWLFDFYQARLQRQRMRAVDNISPGSR